MNKFKKIMLGALSALTLGLFVVTGTNVNAADTTEECTFNNAVSNSFYSISGSYKGTAWSGTSILPSKNAGSVSYNKGLKFNDGGQITFTASNTWSGKILVVNNNSGSKTLGIKVGTENMDESSYSAGASKTIDINGSAGNNTITKSSNSSEATIYEIYIVIEDEGKTLSSLGSVSTSASYCVGDTVSKSDLTVMALYSGESDAVATTKYNFKVYDSNNVEVTGAFESAGNYSIVATSTEDSTKSVSCNITVAAAITYNVTFHPENGGSNTSVLITKGEKITQDNIPAAPSKDEVSFKGWYTSSNVAVTKDTVINADLDVYAQYYESAVMPQSGVTNNILNASLQDDISSDNAVKTPMTIGIFTAKSTNKGIKINSNSKTAGGMSFTKRLQMQATGSASDANISATLTKGKLYVVAQVGSVTKDCELKLYNGTEVVASRNIYGQVATAVSFDIEEAGNYTIYGTNTLNYYYVEFVEESAPEVVTPSAAIGYEENTAGDKIRLVGVLDGIEDLSKIDTIDISFTITRSDNATATKTTSITKVYKSFTDGNHDAKANRYYAVCLVTGLKDLDDNYTYLFTELKITVTFNDETNTIDETYANGSFWFE